MREDARAHFIEHVLADADSDAALEIIQDSVDDRDTCDREGAPNHEALVALQYSRVDDFAKQQGIYDADRGVQRHNDEIKDDLPFVRRAKLEDPLDRSRRNGL